MFHVKHRKFLQKTAYEVPPPYANFQLTLFKHYSKLPPERFLFVPMGVYIFNKKELFAVDTYKWYYGWNLLWWKIEGFSPLNGINVYPFSDPHSAGFVLKAGKFQFRVRWSKRTKKWFIGVIH
jgi:hypothetical protein